MRKLIAWVFIIKINKKLKSGHKSSKSNEITLSYVKLNGLFC